MLLWEQYKRASKGMTFKHNYYQSTSVKQINLMRNINIIKKITGL